MTSTRAPRPGEASALSGPAEDRRRLGQLRHCGRRPRRRSGGTTKPSPELGLDAVVARTGCIGFCQREPLLDLIPPGGPRISYANMTAEKTRRLLEAYAASGDLKPATALCRFSAEEYAATGEKHVYEQGAPSREQGAGSGEPDAADSMLPAPCSPPLWSAVDFYRRQSRSHPAELRIDRPLVAGRSNRPGRLSRGVSCLDWHEGRRGDRRGV